MLSATFSQNIYICSESDRAIVLEALKPFLPFCLSLYRKIQFNATLPSLSSRIISTHSPSSLIDGTVSCFGLAYVDRFARPEVESAIFLSSQVPSDSPVPTPKTCGPSCSNCDSNLLSLLKCISALPVAIPQPSSERPWTTYSIHADKPELHLTGALDSSVRDRVISLKLDHPSRKFAETPYQHIVFSSDDPKLVAAEKDGPSAGLEFRELTKDSHFVLTTQRTSIFRLASTLKRYISLGVFPLPASDETLPISWGFIAADGSLSSLHVEEEYRGKGLAKQLSARLVRKGLGQEGWCHAFVAPDNAASQGVCRGIGGVDMGGTKHWVLIDLAKLIEVKQ